ncbi:outer membrane beta-barrel protein [Roseovarius salis]|uniref:outer membrane protein n=1 Tax=Roseovarius salis TaxID=3376063 RepID=UPI0037CB4522
MKRAIHMLATACLCITGPALAGSYDPPPTPQQPAPTAPEPDWTGFYVGSQVGALDIDTNVPTVDDRTVGAGFTAGYDYDLGRYVVGGALDYDWADAQLTPGLAVENVFRAKMRGGVEVGSDSLVYATGGYAHAETDTLGDDSGYFIGAGYDWRINRRLSFGAEVLYHDFDNFNGTPVDVEAMSYMFRTMIRF